MKETNSQFAFVPIDSSGNFTNEFTISQVNSMWLKAAFTAVESYLLVLRHKLMSVYLRGSVAENKAIENFSDIDLILVCSESITFSELSQLRKCNSELKLKFPFVYRFDFTPVIYQDMLIDSKFLFYQFYIKVLSIKIFGADIAEKFPRFNMSNIILSQLPFVVDKIEKAILQINKIDNASGLKKWSSSAFRSIIRAGLEKTIYKGGQYTRELNLCCQVFSDYYPDQRNKMYQALEFAINPINKKQEILNLLLYFKDWFKHNQSAE